MLSEYLLSTHECVISKEKKRWMIEGIIYIIRMLCYYSPSDALSTLPGSVLCLGKLTLWDFNTLVPSWLVCGWTGSGGGTGKELENTLEFLPYFLVASGPHSWLVLNFPKMTVSLLTLNDCTSHWALGTLFLPFVPSVLWVVTLPVPWCYS